ncbi:MAG TPA: hypothetical protein VND93_10030 [Myxococcales bacterium]|jgi:hypothetical protein|nr:hypothetical protein [Myxococcales bacterium]
MQIWIPVAVAVLGVTFGVGLFARITAAISRRRAPRALALVRQALSRRLPDEARRLLPSAFYMPVSGRYQPEDAAVALQTLSAFEDTMGAYRLSAGIITQDLREALERCAGRGTPVPWRLIGAFMRVLWAVAPLGAPVMTIIRAESQRAAQEEGEYWEDEDGEPREAQLIPVALAPSRGADLARK